MRPRIVLLVDNVNMGLGHPGLMALVRERFQIDPERLEPGQLLMFLNRAKDKLKILGAGGVVLGYLRLPKGRRIMLGAIQYIPRTFGGAGFSYEAALRQTLQERLRPTFERAGPLEAYRRQDAAGLTART